MSDEVIETARVFDSSGSSTKKNAGDVAITKKANTENVTQEVRSLKNLGAEIGVNAVVVEKAQSPFLIHSNTFQKKDITSYCVKTDKNSSLSGESANHVTKKHSISTRSHIIAEKTLGDGLTIENMYEFTVNELLGKGSFGKVVKAKDKTTRAQCAIKIIHKKSIENVRRLKREILIMKRLDHPNIIRLFEVYEDLEHLYLIMELCSGGELFDRILKIGHFTEQYAAVIMKQVLSATSYCHARGIMHRDLKPENLLLVDSSIPGSIRICDWGFATRCNEDKLHTTVLGTPYYVAPEVLRGNYNINCDIWSIGVIMYILLCGYPPFHGKTNKEVIGNVKKGDFTFDPKHWSQISPYAKDLIKRCLSFNPKLRIHAKDALEHAWFSELTGGKIHRNVLCGKLGSEICSRFKNFHNFSKIKRFAITCMAHQLTEKDIGNLQAAFESLDVNNDGALTIEEIQESLAHCAKFNADTLNALNELATVNGGYINYTEFLAAMIGQRWYEQESVIRHAFQLFDTDGDGKITRDELELAILTAHNDDGGDPNLVNEILKEVDTNHDGSIDFNGFISMIRGKQKRLGYASEALSRAKAFFKRVP